MRHVRFAGLVLGLMLLASAASVTRAQEAINFASVSGRVVDASGGVIPGAAVNATEESTKSSTTAVTDKEGRFRLAYLRPGRYRLTIALAGFATFENALSLQVGAAIDLPVTLRVGSVTETITIIDSLAVLETARSQIAGTLSLGEVKAVPLNGRNFLDLALLVPGVAPTNVGGGTQLFPETSAVPGVGLSVGSQRNLSNNFMVDGLSANDDAAALSGISFGVDAIEQFQVVTSGGQAELGRALGGHINIATRSGTNTWRTDGYAFLRDDRMNARNALSGTKLPMHQNQFGGSVGGPLALNRTFMFSNVERRTLDQSGLTTISAANVSAINTRLGAVGYGGPVLSTGVYANPIDTTHLMAKVDNQFSRLRLSIRYNLYDVRSDNARGAGGTNAPSASAGLDNLDQTLAAQSRLVLSDRTLLETRGQIAHSDLAAPPADLIGPAVSISGVAAFGRLSGSPTGRTSTMYQLVGNLVHQRGAHSVKAGADFLSNDLTIEFPRSIRGNYSFSNLTSFLAGTYNTNGFTQTFGDTFVTQANPNLGVYLQDEWRVGSGVTVNGGLRYDLQYLETIQTDTNNVSPRIGVVWSPPNSKPSQQTLVRASAGRFYDRVPLRAVANALLSADNTTDLSKLRQISVSLSPAQTGAPVFPTILAAIVTTTTLVNLTTIDRRLQNAYSNQASVEIERRIGAAATVSVSYQHLGGHNLIMQINQNVPTCAVSGSNNGCRPNPAYANNNQYSAAGRSVYDGLHISLLQHPAKWGSYRVSYSYSRSMNNVGEAFFNSPIDPADPDKDWGRSDDDQRHRLAASGSVVVPAMTSGSLWRRLTGNWQLGGLVQVYSALPFNITTGANTLQGTAARPMVNGEFIERSAGQGSAFTSVNLRLSREFALGSKAHLEAVLEAFNVFDRRNDIARITVFGTGAYPTAPSANFGQVTVVGDPRSIQLGVRVRY